MVDSVIINTVSNCNLSTELLNNQLEKFWHIEEISVNKILSPEETACEEHYVKNTIRDESSGRYIVRLPFKDEGNNLGESYTTALKRFYSLENTLSKNTNIKQDYCKFMKEYEDLGHMTEQPASKNDGYFLPHHAVFKSSSLTTKLRVVFDASAKTSNGISLNDILMTGPTIQDELVCLILRFRFYSSVLTADIEKMYRQILVHPDDRHFQKIIWRNDKSQSLKIYVLNTVTYGTKSASFSAARTLKRLASDTRDKFPRAAEALSEDFYMDDLITGTDSHDEAIILRDELLEATKQAGLNLRQWASNQSDLISDLSENTNDYVRLDTEETIKTLGILWNPHNDDIMYAVNINPIQKITKRSILSQLASLFDPLGLLGPVIVTGKILMQDLWKLKIDWDESLPLQYHTNWLNYYSELSLLKEFKLKRMVNIKNYKTMQLHGFSDASEKAYGACIYVRSVNINNEVQTHLLCAKSRVAPVKTQTLPRLELCAATLLIKLYKLIVVSLKTIKIEAILNSRPLTTLSSDLNDLNPLTPGHFLIGNSMTSIPEVKLIDTPSNKLSSWQHVQQLKQHFWQRWRKDYLHEQTVRKKWHQGAASDIAVGAVVILHQDNIQPLCWPLARVVAVHPGPDGIVRVVTVKNSSGEYTRSVKKLSPLPLSASAS